MVPFAQKYRGSNASWHHVRLEASQLAEYEHERVKMRFNRIYMGARTPRGMRLRMAADDDGADLYLSPQATPIATDLLRRYQARPCDPPAESTVLIAGDGYGQQEPSAGASSTRRVARSRRFLPVPYSCRCVHTMADRRDRGFWLYAGNQLAPFVQRYAKAWALFPPRAKHGR